MGDVRSQLGRMADRRNALPFNKKALIRNAWRDEGILIISADDPDLTWPERELVKQIGDKRNGKRRGDVG